MQLFSLILIHCLVIYPMDSAIQRLNNWGLIANRQFYLKTKLSVLIYIFLTINNPALVFKA